MKQKLFQINLKILFFDVTYTADGVDGSTEGALRQINDRGYAERFALDPRKVFKIGVNFSSSTRSIDGWLIE